MSHHLIVEAEDRAALSRGVQGLCVRVVRAVNRVRARWRASSPVEAPVVPAQTWSLRQGRQRYSLDVDDELAR